MALTVKEILQNLKEVNLTGSTLEILLDFERVLDEMDVYAFENWKMGELVAGPEITKYRVECKFMWPLKKMPNPRGGKRLLAHGIKILFEKNHLSYPVHIQTSDDFKPGSKMPKLKEVPIWIVTINMPKALIKNIQRGSVEIMGQDVDLDELDQSYEENLDNESVQNAEAEQQEQPVGADSGTEQAMPGQEMQSQEQQVAI